MFHHSPSLLGKLVEVHVKRLHQLVCDGSPDLCGVLGRSVRGVDLDGVRLGLLSLKSRLWWGSVGRGEVLMDVDVVLQVLIVRDRCIGLVGDKVEVHIGSSGVVLHAVVQLDEELTLFSQDHIGPWSVLQGHLVGVVVHL